MDPRAAGERIPDEPAGLGVPAPTGHLGVLGLPSQTRSHTRPVHTFPRPSRVLTGEESGSGYLVLFDLSSPRVSDKRTSRHTHGCQTETHARHSPVDTAHTQPRRHTHPRGQTLTGMHEHKSAQLPAARPGSALADHGSLPSPQKVAVSWGIRAGLQNSKPATPALAHTSAS